MSIRIGIASYGGFFKFIEAIRPELPKDVELVILNDLFSELKESVKRIEAEGRVDVFVSAGGNADHLERYLTSIPLVRVNYNSFGLLEAIKEASVYSDNMAVITHTPIPNIDGLLDVFKVNIKPLVYDTTEELSMILQSLYAEGVRDVIGTALVLEMARMYDMRGHFIWNTAAVREAMERAVSMARARRAQAEAEKTLDCLLEYACEGIVIVDRNGVITEFNGAAERILGRRRERVVGRQCAEVLPSTQLYSVMRERRAQFNRVQDMGSVKIVENRSPIICGQEVIGAVAAFLTAGAAKPGSDVSSRSQVFRGNYAHVTFDDMRTVSPEYARLKERAERFARSSSTVLIFGDTGTGKEAFAQSMHNASPRKNEPFVRVNCAAIPSSMFESELFGYEDGTRPAGARRAGKAGLLEQAHQGTLFIDEISEVPQALQARLLSVIEERQFSRIGGEKPQPLDVRIIASTNRDLRELVRQGAFRRDLFYRIDVLELHLPRLTERKGDIPVLVSQLLRENRSDLTVNEIEAISNSQIYAEYNWPGNVRELRNVIERFCVYYSRDIGVEECVKLSMEYRNSFDDGDQPRPAELSDIQEALEASAGNRAAAAAILGISRTTLWRKMREYGLIEEQDG